VAEGADILHAEPAVAAKFSGGFAGHGRFPWV
jgi:hypothetical protein